MCVCVYKIHFHNFIYIYIQCLSYTSGGPMQNCVTGWGGGGGGVGCSWDERMDETHLSMFHSVSNRAHGKRSRSISSVHSDFFVCLFFLMQETAWRSRYMIWLTFYVESVKAHRIKIIDHSCFHNSWSTSKTKLKRTPLRGRGPLMFRGPYAACVFCV